MRRAESAGGWGREAAREAGCVLLKTARVDAENGRSFLFRDPVRVLEADAPEEIAALFEHIEDALRDGFFVAGFLSYEAGYGLEPASLRGGGAPAKGEGPLAWFGVYGAAQCVEERGAASEESGAREESTASEAAPLESVAREESAGEGASLVAALGRAEYAAKVERLRALIAAGDLYQANFTMAMEGACGDAGALFDAVLRNQPVAYGALINTGRMQVVSASPELFFRREGDGLVVRPMKGTAARGRDAAEDAARAAWLAADAKNRAENVMIVDLLRNDLGRICEAGSIAVRDLFAVERHPRLLQMTSTVEGRLRRGTSYYEIFRSLFPCGSITGAPKIRAMQVIRALEGEARGIACGAIGYFAPGGRAVFSVAIRTLEVRAGRMRMRVGSGITYDSEAGAEYDECLLKAAFVGAGQRDLGLIETLRWEGEYFLLELHLKRLAASAAYFDFKCDGAAVRAELERCAREFAGRMRVRLLLARTGDVSVSAEPLTLSDAPARLMVWPEPVNSGDVWLRHKTTRRAVYDEALKAARAAGFDDALFVNERGEVTECSIYNVMVERDGEWLTPAVECGVLPGVYRAHLLAEGRVREAVLRLEDVRGAGRVMVCNAVRGMRGAVVAEGPGQSDKVTE